MATCLQSIGRSNIQTVFVEIETETDENNNAVLKKPTAEGFILPVGNASINQQPTQSDSEERSLSLNSFDQFQDSMPAGEGSVAMYLRMPDDFTQKPQGHSIILSAMGDFIESGTLTMSIVEDTDTEMTVDTLEGGNFLPYRGVIEIDGEYIRYKNRIDTENVGEYKLTGLDRGYNNSTKQIHTVGTATYVSNAYLQSTCRPTVSVWIQYDHTVVFMSGCKPNNTEIALTGTGGQMMTFAISGEKMGICGYSKIVSQSGAVITLNGNGTKSYSIGGYIKNTTIEDDNNGQGYKIIAVNHDAKTITIEKTPLSTWNLDQELSPWLPTGKAVGTVVESRYVRIFAGDFDGILKSSKQREGSLTISTPMEFANEIGNEYVGESSDSKREITLSGGIFFRKEDGERIGKGLVGFEERTDILLGGQAKKTMAIVLPRVKYSTPAIESEGNSYVLNQDGTVMGVTAIRNGESAVMINME